MIIDMKRYIKPETDLLLVELQQMIAASDPNVGIDSTAVEIEPGHVESKGFNIWGDDESGDDMSTPSINLWDE